MMMLSGASFLNGSIVLKNSVGGSGEWISSKSRNLAANNISDLAWQPTRKNCSGSSESALAEVFQHNRLKADISFAKAGGLKTQKVCSIFSGRARSLQRLAAFLANT